MSLLSYPKQMSETISQEATALVSDAELLTQFLKLKNESAFAAIVNRYGNMVFAVAVRIVRDRHAAEDVTQATFLLLAKDVKKIKRREALSSWLHGVAIRLAKKSLKRRSREQVYNVVTEQEVAEKTFEEIHSTFEQQVLDEELNRLPTQYRDPLVLHYLQGKTYEETAQQLGVTLGAIEGRMKRGKRELQLRLTKRGVSLGAVVAALSWSQAEAAAAIQPEIIHTIAQNGIAAFQGTAFTPACSPEAVFLAGKEITMLTTTKITLMTLGLTIAAGAGWATHSGFAQEEDASPQRSAIETAVAQAEPTSANPTSVQLSPTKPPSSVRDSVNPFAGTSVGYGGSDVGVSTDPFGLPGEPAVSNSGQQQLQERINQLQAELEKLKLQKKINDNEMNELTLPAGSAHAGGSGAEMMDSMGMGMEAGAGTIGSSIAVEKNQSPAVEKIMETLDSPNKEMVFVDEPLEGVVEYVRELYQIPVIIDELALQDEGLSMDESISFEMYADQISTRNTLDLMLEKIDLTYIVKKDVLVITSQTEAEQYSETRVYDVRPLQIEDPEALTDVLLHTVSPDSWQQQGGNGEVSFLNGSLIVIQSQEVHEKIEVLLNQLARQVKANPNSPSWPTKSRSHSGGYGAEVGGMGGGGFTGGGQ